MNTTIFLVLFFTGVIVSKKIFFGGKNFSSNDFVKIDDKNYIINGKHISYEKDTHILRLRQEMEDDRHYKNFERQRLQRDREYISGSYLKTKQFIHSHNTRIKTFSAKEKEENKVFEKYQHYCKQCDKLDFDMYKLNYEEFLIMESNPFFTKELSIFFLEPIGCYNIHNENTARYLSGDMNEMMRKEFKEKWY